MLKMPETRSPGSRYFTLIALSALALCPSATAQPRPADLLIYYSFPSTINGAATIADAAAEFGVYDYVVIGDGLQDGPGDPLPHPDHANTVQIINHPNAAGTLFFGYIDLGVITNNHPLSEIERRVDAWQAMGIDGIFLDDFGYDYGVTRARQNAAVDYIHAQGLPVFANGWWPDDLFGDQVNASNPGGLATSLGASDLYLYESHQVTEGTIVPESTWQAKANLLLAYQRALGFAVLSNTTIDAGGAYDQAKFHYAWHTAAIYGHAATAWGEFEYSAATSLAPFRARPVENLGTIYKSGIAKNGSLYTRKTERGTIFVDAGAQTAGFIPDPDADGDGVADTYDLCPGTAPGLQVHPNGVPVGDLDCNCAVDLLDFAIFQANAGQGA
jgi:hypothetical protein